MESQVIIPSSPSDREKIKAVITDINDCLVGIAAKKDYIKEAKAALKEKYELTPKSITLMIKLYNTDTATEHFAEQDELACLYEAIFTQSENDES